MIRDLTVSCLFSHKCGVGICDIPIPCTTDKPCLSCRLRAALKPHGVQLLVDPMRPGDHIRTRMQTFDFDTLLFLISESSLSSEPCAIERETAQTRGRPIFAALESGRLPDEYRSRLCLSVGELDTPKGVSKLALAAHEHCSIRQHLQVLRTASSPPDVTRQLARELYEHDASVLAEHLEELESVYLQTGDEYTRHWLAWAIEHTGARGAVAVLEKLKKSESEPYPVEGIRRALAKLQNVVIGGSHESNP